MVEWIERLVDKYFDDRQIEVLNQEGYDILGLIYFILDHWYTWWSVTGIKNGQVYMKDGKIVSYERWPRPMKFVHLDPKNPSMRVKPYYTENGWSHILQSPSDVLKPKHIPKPEDPSFQPNVGQVIWMLWLEIHNILTLPYKKYFHV